MRVAGERRPLSVFIGSLILSVVADGAVMFAAEGDTRLSGFTTLQVEDIVFRPDLLPTIALSRIFEFQEEGAALSVVPEATLYAEALRSSLVKAVSSRHRFRRVTDVESPELISPGAEPESVIVMGRVNLVVGKGLQQRFRHRADYEDARVPKATSERVLLLRTEIVAVDRPDRSNFPMRTDKVTAHCKLVDKASGRVVLEFEARGTAWVGGLWLTEGTDCDYVLTHMSEFHNVDPVRGHPVPGKKCTVGLDALGTMGHGNLDGEVAKAIEQRW